MGDTMGQHSIKNLTRVLKVAIVYTLHSVHIIILQNSMITIRIVHGV